MQGGPVSSARSGASLREKLENRGRRSSGPARLRLASGGNQNLAGWTAGTMIATAGTKRRDMSKQDARPIGESRNTRVSGTGWRPGRRRIARTKPTKSPRTAALHGVSPSRARCKLRSLFISANSRKQDCSSCQAATPSRVAASASLGT